MIIRAELKQDAKNSLRGKWGIAIGISLIYYAIVGVLGLIPFLGGIAAIITAPALMLGLIIAFLQISRNQTPTVETLFSGFSNIWKAFGLNFMIGIFTLLWLLLLIIPGIIAAISYSMAFYILADNPNIGIFEAIKESKRMTNGYKMDIFVLYLSFIGWCILATLTFGIGYIWLFPYMQTTLAYLYNKLKGTEENVVYTYTEPSKVEVTEETPKTEISEETPEVEVEKTSFDDTEN